MRTRSLIPPTLLVALLLTSRAWSQTTTEASSTAQTAVVTADSEVTIKDEGHGPAATKSKDASGADTLSVDFPDEDIRNILRNVADLFELNLVVPDTLQGRTSIKLRDVTWRQIFHVVLSPVNFTYVEEGNIIKIVSNESLLQEPLATEVFIINYAPAAELSPALAPLVTSAGASIKVDSRSNALIITERASQMNRIRPIIEKLDKATAQVMIESKFVEVTNTDIKNIGVNWASLNGMNIGVSRISQTWDRGRGQNTNDGRNGTGGNTVSGSSATQTGNTNQVNNGTNSSNQGGNTNTYVTGLAGGPGATVPSTLNFPSGSVSGLPASVGGTTTAANYSPAVPGTPAVYDLAGNLTSAAVPGTAETATAINTFNGTTSNTITGSTATGSTGSLSDSLNTTASNAVNSLFGLANNGSTNRLASAVFSASDFNIILSALKTKNDTKLVSNPTVVTLNNSEAMINIGKEYPIPRYTYNAERGSYEVSGFDYRPIGIILKVTPQVNAQGFIKLSIEPEVSSSVENANFGTAQIPIVTTRKTKTQVSLKDGYTMGIGGLIENTIQNGQTRVPVLGSIPLLGRLFRSDSKNDQIRNLIIFITAKTVSAEGAPIEEVFDPRAIRRMGLRRDELPGYRDGSDPFLAPETADESAKASK
ncbi:MAG: hypothetical protein KA257_11255 [Opitutaceae bacterium]|nr:hypothetical protein [Opitutaceae bacterium]